MSATGSGDIQDLPVERYSAVDDVMKDTYPVQTVRITPQLEEFMKKVCDLVDNHPEWMHQKPPERVKNILSAIRQL